MTVRRTIRVKAFQALFQLNNNFRMTTDQAIKHALTYSLNKGEENIDDLEAIKQILPVKVVDDQMAEENLAYLTDLVTGVRENQKFLDEQLEKRLKNWSILSIEITYLIILRLSSYDLSFLAVLVSIFYIIT